jgi:acetaldehyde dehydrogenase (acetylating)
VVDEPIAEAVEREFQANGGHFMSKAERDAVAAVLVTPQRLPNPVLVGKTATFIAEKCGITVPADTRVLLARLEGVGRDHPLSIEKLCPVLSYYVVDGWREGCERCKQILRYGGMGHTMAIHSQNEAVILEFGLKKPAFRIVVNTPTAHGSIGLTTGLDPAMTLGCGGYGGNITSDNISPRHLLNVKRLAYEISPAANRFERARAGAGAGIAGAFAPVRLPSAAAQTAAEAAVSADALTARIDEFLGTRGYRPEPSPGSVPPGGWRAPSTSAAAGAPSPLDFVCEEDVRLAIRAGRKLVVSERAIVTPAARELAEEHRVFTVAPWRA